MVQQEKERVQQERDRLIKQCEGQVPKPRKRTGRAMFRIVNKQRTGR